MTAPLSNDLRERVVKAMAAGESSRSVAAWCGDFLCDQVGAALSRHGLGGP